MAVDTQQLMDEAEKLGKLVAQHPAIERYKSAQKSVAEASQPFDVMSESKIEMVYLPGGEFTMGSDKGNPDEAPAHKVKLSPFLIDKFEVTQEMFAKVQLPNPSHWNENPKKPVERVRWRDAKQYCNERSLAEGLKPCYDEKTVDWNCDFTANGYRLPTEAEWEYACKAGGNDAFDFGQAEKLRQFAWSGDRAVGGAVQSRVLQAEPGG